MKNILILFLSLFIIGCVPKNEININNTTDNIYRPHNSIKITDKKLTMMENIEDNIAVDVYKVALVFPSKVVGKYSYDLVNTVSTYLLEQHKEFKVEIFDSLTEDSLNLEDSFESLKEKGFKDVIALITDEGFSVIKESDKLKNLRIYFPIINKKSFNLNNKNFIFGGINYKQQLEKLVLYSDEKIVDFYDESTVGNRLNDILKELTPNIVYEREIDSRNSLYKNIVNDKRVDKSTIILNTPIIKSSILLSQIRANEKIVPKLILSTQLNYTNLIFALTQKEDRENLIVVNSIGEIDKKLVEKLELLDVDINYNFLAYSSLIGIDYLFSNNKSKLINYGIVENEVVYSCKLYKTLENSFEEIK